MLGDERTGAKIFKELNNQFKSQGLFRNNCVVIVIDD